MQSFIKKFLIISALIFPIAVFASPGIPHQFYGTVSFTSGDTPDGLLVEAKIDNVSVGSTVTDGGRYGDSVFYVTDPDGDRNGKTIKFYVSGIDSGETAIFVNGESTKLNLTVPGTISEPEPTPSPGGSTPTPTTPAPTPGPLSEEAQKVDANNDNKIDILDFNTLMVNWGSTLSGNIADFNKDSKIDIFDFNLLMIHWTG